MAFSVSDIIGVGFKYEQTAEEQLVPPAVGTRTAVLGTAHWGPIGVPTAITTGRQEFRSRFGQAGTSADEGWEAADYHFKWSSLGYFTRIASSTNKAKRSYKLVESAATPATRIGNVDIVTNGINLIPGQTLGFTVTHKDTAMATPEDIAVSIDFAAEGVRSYGGTISRDYTGVSGSTLVGSNLSFEVYDETGTVTVNSPYSYTGSGSYVDLATLVSGVNAANAGFATTDGMLSVSGSTVTLTSEPYHYGSNSRVKILTATGIFATMFPVSPQSAREDYGMNASASLIIDAINDVVGAKTSTALSTTLAAAYGPSFSFADTNDSGYIVLTNPTAGTSSSLEVTTGNTLLGVSTGTAVGTTGISVGTLRAFRRGFEGDTLEIEVSNSDTENPSMNIYFRGSLVGSVANYNFDVNSNDNLGKILAESSALSQLIVYDHGKLFEVFDEDDANLDTGEAIPGVTSANRIGDGIWTLSGGSSGETNINITKDIVDKIKEYSSVDLYDVDIIAAPGYPEQAIQDALTVSVAEERQDTWVITDLPEIAGNNAVDNAIRWTNGQYTGRNVKFDSTYASIYFPYIKIRKATYDSSLLIQRILGDYTPTTRVLGMAARNDFLATTKFASPAGEIRGLLEDVEGVQVTLTQTDRDRLYGDVYDGIINPVNFNIQSGFFVGGQKTGLRKNANGKLTALSRINVMRTGLYIKKEVQKQVKFFFFEPNDPRSWSDFRSLIIGIMNFLVERRAIEDNYIVKCDASTNTPDITNNNGMIATIEWTPIKSIERIKVISSIKERRVTTTVG